MSRINRSYSKEFIKESVNYALNAVSISFAAKELGIPEATLTKELQELRKQVYHHNTSDSLNLSDLNM